MSKQEELDQQRTEYEILKQIQKDIESELADLDK